MMAPTQIYSYMFTSIIYVIVFVFFSSKRGRLAPRLSHYNLASTHRALTRIELKLKTYTALNDETSEIVRALRAVGPIGGSAKAYI